MHLVQGSTLNSPTPGGILSHTHGPRPRSPQWTFVAIFYRDLTLCPRAPSRPPSPPPLSNTAAGKYTTRLGSTAGPAEDFFTSARAATLPLASNKLLYAPKSCSENSSDSTPPPARPPPDPPAPPHPPPLPFRAPLLSGPSSRQQQSQTLLRQSKLSCLLLTRSFASPVYRRCPFGFGHESLSAATR
ncbi:hypothetical protein Mp_2g07620 [Marchantia polymorpha subsp. ruderalis]|uniref:Uncharacterized protein n=1 Tax=Marchantia polymorpha TaxID=3197 RepID=A0A2R6XGK0_MARPO|nr:hypothetical protein MARPO_0015s0048 [Marchantia polymorpha]BBN01470.1 hypothetical protein Mp_2g07620 [Marchantia polymorpha subsp. ruderalis]|eukprot:PTQ45237.1 hypothetical protein MARPO_0015s0048 [Marchantia polymorpha]